MARRRSEKQNPTRDRQRTARTAAIPRDPFEALGAFGVSLAILAAVLLVNLYSAHPFEPSKVLLVRILGALLLLPGVVLLSRTGGGLSTLRNDPTAIAVLAYAAVQLIATVVSVEPDTSLRGTSLRLGGLYTQGTLLLLFAVARTAARSEADRATLADTVLLAAIGTSTYALVQFFGLDPIDWQRDASVRVEGAAGNAIFLGAVTAFAIPIAFARMAGTLQARDKSPYPWLAVATYACIAGVCIAALVLARSRGPILGLGAGIAFAVLVAIAKWRPAWLRALIAGGVALAAGVAFLTYSGGVDLMDAQHLGRESDRTRLSRELMYQSAAGAWRASVPRALVGHGPETFWLTAHAYLPGELGSIEGHGHLPDRAHNHGWDVLVTSGLLGYVAYLSVFYLVLAAGFTRLGIATHRHRSGLAMAAVAGAAVGAGAFYFIQPNGVWWPHGSVAGMLVGVALGLARWVNTDQEAEAGTDAARTTTPANDYLVIGLLAALVCHLIEIQAGIATIQSQVLFWVCAGVLTSRDARGIGRHEPVDLHVPLQVGFALMVVTFALCPPAFTIQRDGMTVAMLLGAAWVVGAVLYLGSAKTRDRMLPRFAAASIGPWIAFGTLLTLWHRWRPTEPTGVGYDVALGHHQALSVVPLVCGVVGTAILAFAVLERRTVPAAAATRRATIVAGLVVVLSALLAVGMNVRIFQAEGLSRMASLFAERGDIDSSLAMITHSLRIRPADRPTVRQLAELAIRFPEQESLRQHAREALLALPGAALDPVAQHDLARVHRAAALQTNGPQKRAHLEQSIAHYRAALDASPRIPKVWNQYADTLRKAKKPREALESVDASVRLDPSYLETRVMRGEILSDLGRFDEAVAAYEHVLAVRPKHEHAWIGMAFVLHKLGRLDDAIAANRKVTRLRPEDPTAAINLALLFRKLGNLPKARKWAQKAKALVGPEQQRALTKFVEEVRAEQAARRRNQAVSDSNAP